MKHFNLTHMIDKYGSPIVIKRKTGGGFDEWGVIIPEEEIEIESKGIISVFSDDEVVFADGGRYDTDNIKLYINELIDKADVIVHNGHDHLVVQHRDYSDLAQPYIYALKRRDNPQ